MTINSKEMIAELKKNGRTTTVPYHNRDLAIGLEKAIRKQAGI